MTSTWITDLSSWQDQLDLIGGYDFYQLPGYIEQEALLMEGEARAFHYQRDGFEALLPLIVRSVPGQEGKWRDAISPYGYPGIVMNNQNGYSLFEEVVSAYHDFANREGIVSTFIRLHPLHNTALLPEQKGIAQTFRGKTYSIYLPDGVQSIRANYSSNHRRNLKKLLRLGFKAVFDRWDLLEQWQSIYVSTMERLGAGDYYKFDLSYFETLKEKLNCRLVTVLDTEGEVACGGVFTYYADVIQYHLGGTAARHLAIAPSKLMFDAVMEEGVSSGNLRSFHLGGGVGARDDSLARFKRGFSNREHWFRTLEMIHHKDVYGNLSAGLKEDGFFPLYRKV